MHSEEISFASQTLHVLKLYCTQCGQMIFNSLAPGKFQWNFRYAIFKQILVINGWVISCEIALIWMSLDFTDDQSTLVQVMAWCRQATSHYLSQCWPRSLSPYGVTKPQWVKAHTKYLIPSVTPLTPCAEKPHDQQLLCTDSWQSRHGSHRVWSLHWHPMNIVVSQITSNSDCLFN